MAPIERLLAFKVSKSFRVANAGMSKALDHVTVELRSDLTLGIIGESGSGKSTLGRLLLGLAEPSDGIVTFNGHSLPEVFRSRQKTMEFRRTVQFIGQDTTSSFDPLRTLRDSVRTPLQSLCGLSRAEADDRVDEVLRRLSLKVQLADRYPQDVSGGQRQRFAIARAIVVNPRILICDEVVSALDVSIQGSILNLLKDYCRESPAGLAFITHSLPAAGFIADQLIVMNAGQIVESGSTRDIIENCTHPFTMKLVNAYGGGRSRRGDPAPGAHALAAL